uniref:Response regulator receiver domain-containing protein n=1 Tax=Candidatus Kentrum sp. MB TaxID=2138164 RepID=A0A451BBF6_9GAMM|nr:MAG: Response regulator receiver domain-containing protein [Candidatus Kentron sp. MB]VFK75633.1 MAG: Response regulator receiver domain-containing protein [Candidatus Kentron sp. MB]
MQAARILVVDDDPGIVKQFTRALESEKYRVEPAYSGEEAWEKYQQAYFDVVITDWQMGEMSGVDLARKIDVLRPGAHVIIVTAFGDEFEKVISLGRDYHPFDYLQKMVDMNVLLKKVAQAVARRDPIIEALEEWVEKHPEEADEQTHVDFSNPPQTWSAREMLAEIQGNTERGREEYKDMVKLTFYLMTHGNIAEGVMECARNT